MRKMASFFFTNCDIFGWSTIFYELQRSVIIIAMTFTSGKLTLEKSRPKMCKSRGDRRDMSLVRWLLELGQCAWMDKVVH